MFIEKCCLTCRNRGLSRMTRIARIVEFVYQDAIHKRCLLRVCKFSVPKDRERVCKVLYQCGLYTFRLSEALENHISAPAECHTRIHSVDFGAKGV